MPPELESNQTSQGRKKKIKTNTETQKENPTNYTKTKHNPIKLAIQKAGRNKTYFPLHHFRKGRGREVGGRKKQHLFAISLSDLLPKF